MAELATQEVLEGKFSWLIFQAADSDFRIISIKTPAGLKTLKGNNLPTSGKTTYRFHGTTVTSAKGPCFHVNTFEDIELEKLEESMATGTGNILKQLADYICSGVFPGIGKKTAQNIVDMFGEDSLRIIKEETMKLVDVKGISEKKACALQEYLKENTYISEVKTELMKYGISDDACRKLISIYKEDTLKVVRENPYSLIHTIRMAFLDADKMAIDMGFELTDEIRLRAAFKHVMNKAISDGHTGMEYYECGEAVMKLLDVNGHVDRTVIVKLFRDCREDETIKVAKLPCIDGKDRFFMFPWTYYETEKSLAENIYRIRMRPVRQVQYIDEQIEEVEYEKGITLDPVQKEAIKTCLNSAFSVLTGGPGTGKTTIMDFIVELYERNINKNIVLLAPSGKAARKLAESTGRETKTIHSQLNIYDVDSEDVNADYIRDSIVIIDEFSMVDTKICNLLFDNIDNGCRVVCVGDIDQLPSVGAGAVLRDILDEDSITQVRLTRTFRQDADSNILQNTIRVNAGVTELVEGDDFHIYKESDLEECKKKLTDLYMQRIKEYGIENVMMLLPYRKKVIAGVDDMNKHLQNVINPPSEDKVEGSAHGRTYRIGDPVMHVNGNTELVSNGDTGVILNVVYVEGVINVYVKMNGQTIIYDKETLEHLELAYATTIHKSQGSEYLSVITCLTYNHGAMLFRNIPYVAFSRGKKVVDVVCDAGLDHAIKTTKSNERVTLLRYLLQQYSGRMYRDVFCLK